MSAKAKQLEQELMKLSAEERAELADKLWISLESSVDVDAAWADEIARRLRDIDSGNVKTIPHEDVVAELRARYGR
jgi:putative addiction module component (TIGR02574 family)